MRNTTIKGFAAGLTFGAVLVATAATARAEEPDRATIAYTATFAGAVCNVLDQYPSFEGILGIGKAIMADGLSAEQAGWVVGLSVLEVCPRHTDLMMAFLDRGTLT